MKKFCLKMYQLVQIKGGDGMKTGLKVLLVIVFIAAGCLMGLKGNPGTAIVVFCLAAVALWEVVATIK